MRTTAILICLAYNVHSELTSLTEFVGIDYLHTVIKEFDLDVAPVVPVVERTKIKTIAAGFAQGVIAGEKKSWDLCDGVALPNVALITSGIEYLRQGFQQRNLTMFFEGLRNIAGIEENIPIVRKECSYVAQDAKHTWDALKTITSFKCYIYKLKKNSRTFRYQILSSIANEVFAIRDENWHAVGKYLGMVFHFLNFGDYWYDGVCTKTSENSCAPCHDANNADHCGNHTDSNNVCIPGFILPSSCGGVPPEPTAPNESRVVV